MPIVAETEQIPSRRNSPLNSRAQISDGSGERFFIVLGNNLRLEFNALRSVSEQSSGSDGEDGGPARDRAAYWLRCCPSDRSRWASNGYPAGGRADVGQRFKEFTSSCASLVEH